MQWVALIGNILEGILALAQSATSGQANVIITMLNKFISIAVAAAPNLLVPIQNIITALEGNGSVTADQIALLKAQSAIVDAALDAAAKADGLSGVPTPTA